MRVRVVSKINNLVHCSTLFGDLNVIWEGKEPQIDSHYDVELDLYSVLSWGHDILKVQKDASTIMCNKDTVNICGTLESVDSDGYSVLRIGNYIIPFNAQGKAFDIGSAIEICVDSIVAYPIP